MSVASATAGVCPVCQRRVPAERVRRGRAVWLRKHCPEHGEYETMVWCGLADIDAWCAGLEDPSPAPPPCPTACGLCSAHLRATCCVLLEVTARCNLSCRWCFAGDGAAGPEPTFQEIDSAIRRLTDPGHTLLQLSGGEPTLRDDLPRIVAAARAAGCAHVQLNTNGLRLAEDEAYTAALAAAGLSFVFLQFDGDDAAHTALRGRPLSAAKERAIARCAAHNLGVTLVPTLVPGVNTAAIGDILHFAVAHAPGVRGVHFQPVTYLGRHPGRPGHAGRLTLDELLAFIVEQSAGMIRPEHLRPSCCDHPLCGFHGDFVVTPGGGLLSLSPQRETSAGGVDGGKTACCGGDDQAVRRNREFVARRWQRPVGGAEGEPTGDMRDMDYFLERVKSHGFTVTAMAFQDADTLDLERLRRCSLHVFRDGRFVPFCAHYLGLAHPHASIR